MATKAKMTKLTDLDTKGVAVVTAGANNKRWAFAKSAAEAQTFEDLLVATIAKGETGLDEATIEAMCAQAGLDPQMAETIKAIAKLRHVYRDNDAFLGVVKQLVGGSEQAAAEQPKQDAPPADAPPKPAPPAVDAPKPEATPAEGEQKPEAPPVEGEKQQEPEMPEPKKDEPKTDVAKAADAQLVELKKSNEALEAIVKAQEQSLKAQQVAVQKMQDDMRLAQWVSKAKDELAHVPGETAETMGKTLFDIDSLSPELAKKQFETFKKTAEIVKASSMFRPSGVSGAAPAVAGSAAAEIDRLAAEQVSKSTSNEPESVRLARARTQVIKSNRELYARSLAEARGQGRN